jgi:hypothetical protein
VRLLGAQIAGQLSFDGAELDGGGGYAFNAERLRVDGIINCNATNANRLEANGELRLLAAHITGQLSLAGAILNGDSGDALRADGMRVDTD